MATYAAYRHIELDKIGYGKKRVLKPPGGGSSDIFGTSPKQALSPRSFSRLQQRGTLGSMISGTDSGSALGPKRNKPAGNNTHSRLFGTPDPPQNGNGKNRMRSNIVLGENAAAQQAAQSASMVTNGDHAPLENGNGDGHSDNASVTSNGSSHDSSVGSSGRSRVPPGGFSNGLW